MRLQSACELFLSHCRSATNLSEHTLRAYAGDLKHAQGHIGRHRMLGRIDKECLRKYIGKMRNELALSESTIKRRIACMKLLFGWARQEAILKTNPFDTLNEKIRLPRRLPRSIDSVDCRDLKKAVIDAANGGRLDDHCSRVAVSLLIETGIRVGELSKIKVEDVSIADRSIRIHGKGNRQRLVYLLSRDALDAVSKLLRMRERSGVRDSNLMVRENGKVMTPQVIRKILREFREMAGIKRHITPHMLRHTCATRWIESGLDIRFVQKLLGHHSISTTEIYTHVSDKSLKEALLRTTGNLAR
jgi:integrase/recombinase XerD